MSSKIRKPRTIYGGGTFKDPDNAEHRFIMCGVVDDCLETTALVRQCSGNGENNDTPAGFGTCAHKVVRFGIAVCNPMDDYDAGIGMKIAYNRALNPGQECAWIAVNNVVLDKAMLLSIMERQVRDVQESPEKYFTWFAKRLFMHIARQAALHDYLELTDSDKNLVASLIDIPRNRILKLLNLASRFKGCGISVPFGSMAVDEACQASSLSRESL